MKKTLSAILLSFILAFSMVGCSNDTGPKATVDDYLSAWQDRDVKELAKLQGKDKVTLEDLSNNTGVELTEAQKAKNELVYSIYFDKLKYVIKDVKEDKDKATVTVEITTPGVREFLQAYLDEYNANIQTVAENKEQALKITNEKMKDKVDSYKDKKVTINLELEKNKDSKWIIPNIDILIGAAYTGE